MTLFGTNKGKKDPGSSELVLAYLEDAQRVRCSFTLRDGRKLEISAVLQSLDEETDTMRFHVSGPFSADKGAKVDFLFILEGMRLGGHGKFQENHSNLVVLSLPEELELMERRKHSRAKLNPKEGATITALTGLFEGTGINGILENISESGCRVKVEKALNIKDERRLPLGTALFSPGQAFMLLKFNKVPKCPAVMELTGKLVYLSDSGGLSLGILFETPRRDLVAAIQSLVSSRASAIPTSVPPKARRKAAEEPLLADPMERMAKTRLTEEPLPKEPVTPPAPPPKPQPVQTEPVPEPVPPVEPVEEAGPPALSPALLRLKKRSRTLLLLAPSGYGNLLKDYLQDEGYGRVLMAATPQEMVSILAQDCVALVLIDIEIPILECFEMISNLKESELELPPVILAAEEVSIPLVLAAKRSGVSQLLVKPYTLDESFSSLLEQQMEIC